MAKLQPCCLRRKTDGPLTGAVTKNLVIEDTISNLLVFLHKDTVGVRQWNRLTRGVWEFYLELKKLLTSKKC